jgi:hypothetical protein
MRNEDVAKERMFLALVFFFGLGYLIMLIALLWLWPNDHVDCETKREEMK